MFDRERDLGVLADDVTKIIIFTFLKFCCQHFLLKTTSFIEDLIANKIWKRYEIKFSFATIIKKSQHQI